MRIKVLVPATSPSIPFDDAARSYLERAYPPYRAELCVVRVAARRGNAAAARRAEGQRLAAALDPRAHVVALDLRAKTMTSEAFAAWLDDLAARATRAVTFLIGGPDGLDPSVSARAATRLSLSPMTLPHGLAALVLCEQIYRAATIARGHPYHR